MCGARKLLLLSMAKSKPLRELVSHSFEVSILRLVLNVCRGWANFRKEVKIEEPHPGPVEMTFGSEVLARAEVRCDRALAEVSAQDDVH